MTKRSGVNWGRERLRKYESVYSICAKFSVLNGLTPAQTAQFLSQQLGGVDIYRFRPTDAQARRLARLLDEPLNIVKTLLLPADIDLSRTPCMVEDGEGLSTKISGIRYCVECLKAEFHSFFHQFSYLVLCPIHRTALKYDSGPYSPSSLFERNVRILTGLYQRFTQCWPAPPGRLPILAGKQNEQKSLKEYLTWSSETCERMAGINTKVVWKSVADPPFKPALTPGQQPVNAMSAVIAYLGAPNELVLGLLPPMLSMFLSKRHFCENTRKQLRETLDHTSLVLLLELFRGWWIWTKQPRIGDEALESFVERLLGEHTKCECVWTLDLYSGWFHRRPDGPKPNFDQCPYVHTANLLSKRWGDFQASVSQRQTIAVLSRYRNLVEHFVALEMISLEARGNSLEVFFDPVNRLHLTWRLPEKLINLLETIVETEMMMDVEVMSDWLSHITDGQDPNSSNCLPIYSTLTETDNGLELTRWAPTGREASAKLLGKAS
jgi:hypothetical protein